MLYLRNNIVKSILNNLSTDETLHEAIDNGIIDYDNLAQKVAMTKREEILKNHPYEIWQNAKGVYFTYLPDKNSKEGRVRRKSKSLETLKDSIVKFYCDQEKTIYFTDVFEEWINRKLEFDEIKKQSYDRYYTDYDRFFIKSDNSIVKKKFSNITSCDLEEFIKTSIRDFRLTKKTYSGLELIIRGVFKYGKSKKYTDLSISQFLDDLDMPNSIFAQKEICDENKVFMEDELCEIVAYLKSHVDIWNMALLLQLQTGMRIGEIAALKWEDVEENSIHVCRTEVKQKDKNKVSKILVADYTKTVASNRHEVIPQTAKWTLNRIKELNQNGEYLFMNQGKRIRGNTLNKRLEANEGKINIIKKSSHSARRTYVTTLIDNNVNESIVSDQVGHTNVLTTKKLYYRSNKRKNSKIKQINEALKF